jgi:hypothetical protein
VSSNTGVLVEWLFIDSSLLDCERRRSGFGTMGFVGRRVKGGEGIELPRATEVGFGFTLRDVSGGRCSKGRGGRYTP